MLEEQDFIKIGEVIKENTEVNSKKLREEVTVVIEANNIKISEVIEEKIKANNIKIGEEVCKVIEQNIVPVLDNLDKRLTKIESNMTTVATKDDLNRGVASIKGDLTLKLRDEDRKVNLLIRLLQEKNLLKEEDVQILKQIEVFPQF